MNTSIYQNIATRTAGDIYIGVVGPVRTGKSTFIKRFMETQVIPNIDNVYRKERARDVADQVIFMDGGVIVEQGDAHQVIEHPREERTRQFLARYSEG